MVFWKAKGKGRSSKAHRCVVLGLDGLGLGLLEKLTGKGGMPRMAALLEPSHHSRMRSVLPTVSSVAWASYATGVNPAAHNVFGFIDRNPDPFELFIPDGSQLKHETIWEALSRVGKRVAVLNVPMSYPPRAVNGVMVGCFLSPSLEKAVHPKEMLPFLQSRNYRLDADSWKAREDLGGFIQDLGDIMDARFRVALELLDTEPWDLLQLHVMETDRINHFLLSRWEEACEPWAEKFLGFYARLDHWIERLLERLQREVEAGELSIMILSDHGFCRVKAEVYVNRWLEDNGYLHFDDGVGRKPNQFLSRSRAYSLIPGRVFINLRGREERGSVLPGREYEALREELIRGFLELKDPLTGQAIIRKVHRREDLYSGPFLERAADLILEPHDGFDLKGNTDKKSLTGIGDISGMHTLEDAFLMLWPEQLPERRWEIQDAAQVISSLLELQWGANP
ncbi:MAG: alkaline phosphatase family protein [Thermodesulfobacteriota bacterium]